MSEVLYKSNNREMWKKIPLIQVLFWEARKFGGRLQYQCSCLWVRKVQELVCMNRSDCRLSYICPGVDMCSVLVFFVFFFLKSMLERR